jgi:hypothetical protein
MQKLIAINTQSSYCAFVIKIRVLSKTQNIDFDDKSTMSTLCVDGYKFLHTNKGRYKTSGQAFSMTTVQMFEERDGKSLPTKC